MKALAFGIVFASVLKILGIIEDALVRYTFKE